jgi:hypothetical protein
LEDSLLNSVRFVWVMSSRRRFTRRSIPLIHEWSSYRGLDVRLENVNAQRPSLPVPNPNRPIRNKQLERSWSWSSMRGKSAHLEVAQQPQRHDEAGVRVAGRLGAVEHHPRAGEAALPLRHTQPGGGSVVEVRPRGHVGVPLLMRERGREERERERAVSMRCQLVRCPRSHLPS